jgi:hypothetical protein
MGFPPSLDLKSPLSQVQRPVLSGLYGVKVEGNISNMVNQGVSKSLFDLTLFYNLYTT